MKKINIKSITLLIKLLIIILIFYLIIIINFICYRHFLTTKESYDIYTNKSQKVILFIGDGMGENHIKVTEKSLNKKLFFTNFKSGKVRTFSKELFIPTDSAASATALATGIKVKNGNLSMYKNKKLKTISEYVKSLNKGVGIVTTDSLAGATPSAFSSHATSRNDSTTIIKNQLISNIDIFLGSGYDTYKVYQEDFKNNNYFFSNSLNLLNNSYDKIIGSFTKIRNSNSTNLEPELVDLTRFAINFLEAKYPNGYFLMIEGAHIDKMSHNNDIFEMINYLTSFDIAINAASSLLKDSNYTIIVTADHETGGITFNENSEISNKLFKTKSHTSRNVLYYIDSSTNINLNSNIDNTDIYKLIKALLSNK